MSIRPLLADPQSVSLSSPLYCIVCWSVWVVHTLPNAAHPTPPEGAVPEDSTTVAKLPAPFHTIGFCPAWKPTTLLLKFWKNHCPLLTLTAPEILPACGLLGLFEMPPGHATIV